MGKAIENLNNLLEKRENITNQFESLMNRFGFIMDEFGRSWNESRYEMNMKMIDEKIRAAESAALEEREKEVAESLLKEMTDTCSKAGREIAAAFESGLNSRK